MKNKNFKNSLDKLLPQKMIDTIIDLSGIDPDKKVNEITKKERINLVELLKDFKLTIKDFRPIEEAIITSKSKNNGIKISTRIIFCRRNFRCRRIYRRI